MKALTSLRRILIAFLLVVSSLARSTATMILPVTPKVGGSGKSSDSSRDMTVSVKRSAAERDSAGTLAPLLSSTVLDPTKSHRRGFRSVTLRRVQMSCGSCEYSCGGCGGCGSCGSCGSCSSCSSCASCSTPPASCSSCGSCESCSCPS
jgi:hypothetical protein